jgi:surface polysaccharide O-acyltransferase-like enzyme
MQVNSKRVESADAMRVIAMLAIIHIHSPLKWGTKGMSLDSVANLDQLARFAVPFFFIISGYFWAAGCFVASDYWRRRYRQALPGYFSILVAAVRR